MCVFCYYIQYIQSTYEDRKRSALVQKGYFHLDIKIGPVMVISPQLYAQTPPIQNLGETQVACKISAHLDLNWQSYSH